MRSYLVALLLVMTVFAGCLTDNDNKDDNSAIDSIDQLSMGGSLFIFREQGFALSQFGAFDGENVFGDAKIYVNGVKLDELSGVYSKVQQLGSTPYTPGSSVKIAVYAFGDSVVKNIIVPKDPVIIEPETDLSKSLGDTLLVSAAFPGKSDHNVLTLAEFADSWELPADKTITIPFPPDTFKKTGEETLNVFSINASDVISDNLNNLNNQYEIFLIAAVASRKITFTAAE